MPSFNIWEDQISHYDQTALKVFTRERSSNHFNIVVYNITKQAFLEKQPQVSSLGNLSVRQTIHSLQRTGFTKFPWCGNQRYL